MRFLATFGPALVGLAASAHAASINYTTVKEYFLQDESSTDASTFDYVGTALVIGFTGLWLILGGVDRRELWAH